MGQYVLLAGPTLDKAMGLIRLGRLKATPIDMGSLAPGVCIGTASGLAEVRATAQGKLQDLLTPTANAPVHVYVAREREAHKCKEIRHHVCRTPLPPGSFMTIGDGVAVPSWELYYMLLCRKESSLTKRLMLGMELCGTYTHMIPGNERTATYYQQPSIEAEGKLVARWNDPKVKSAVTVEELRSWLSAARGVRGACYAAEAARYLKDGSASPLETNFAIMATLPCKLGGYGFVDAVLNPEIKVTANKRHLTSADAYHPDCFLEAMDTDLEVESRERHSGPKEVERDKARRNDIQALGIEVKDVTWDIFSHFDRLELLFRQLLEKEREKGLDKRGNHARMVCRPENVARRRALLQEVLGDWIDEMYG